MKSIKHGQSFSNAYTVVVAVTMAWCSGKRTGVDKWVTQAWHMSWVFGSVASLTQIKLERTAKAFLSGIKFGWSEGRR